MAPRKAKDDGQITIPEDLSTLGDSDLADLHDKAVTAFQAMLPAEGEAPDDATLTALSALAEGVEALKAEVATRDSAALGRSAAAKELADQVLNAGVTAEEVLAEEGDEEEAEEEPATDEPVLEDLAAGAKKRPPINIDLGSLVKSKPETKDEPVDDKPKTVAFAAQGAAGFDVGKPMTIRDMAESINSRLGGFNAGSYAGARRKGERQQERFTIARLPRKFDERAVVNTEDPRDAMKFAADERNTDQGSLVASGGWCAPSETMYELVDISEAENLISVPEIQINRGGVRHTLGPDYSVVFADTGFCYTEAEDIAGDYDGEGAGVKPCVTVPCPDFDDVRLGYCGVCIGAGLLQQRGYPEVIVDYINKTLNAHAHRMSASVINSMAAASTAVTFASNQAGAAAPLLAAVDLQATHYRAVNRMSDTATLEVLLPTWVKALLRADLSRRLGLAELDVSDSRIAAWFANRNVSVQYVVDWQDIATTAASGFVCAPSGVQFLLYAAGTFVKGVTDSLTFENIYDSVLLGTNDYTALFTEDPFLVLKRNHDARRVTVPVSPDGAAHIGVEISACGVAS